MSNTTTNPAEPILTLDNPSFSIYLICACLLVLKIMGVTLLTIYQRMKHKAFISPEDAKWKGGEVTVNDAVERTRRAHLNDLENIPIFLAAAFAYLWTQPHPVVAGVLYFAFTGCRAVHTVVYTIFIVPQPTRAIVWAVGYLITGYLAVHSALYAFIYLVK